MTKEEIYRILSDHMVQGLMLHSKLADFYGFLSFKGYQKCHEYHYIEENINYRKLINYYLYHCGKLIPDTGFNKTDVIPENWFQHSRNDVGNETKLNSLKVGIDKWVKWEINTKQLYERMYGELISLNEIAAGENLMIFIKDVDNELAEAQQEMLEITTMNYDLNDIMMKQEDIFKTYKKKLNEIKYD